jgi:hypothetical protein
VRGQLLLARVQYIRSHPNEALLEHVLAQLAPAEAETLRGQITPVSWYPLHLQHRLDDAIASIISPDDHSDSLIEMGRAYAEAILLRVQLEEMKLATPKSFLQLVPHLYSAYHAAAGHREYQSLGDHAAVIRTIGAGDAIVEDHCWTVVGGLQRGLELSGAESALVMETACCAAGAPCCEYRCEWHAPTSDGRR